MTQIPNKHHLEVFLPEQFDTGS